MKTSLYLQIKLVVASCDTLRPDKSKLEDVRARLLTILEEIDPYRFKRDDYFKKRAAKP